MTMAHALDLTLMIDTRTNDIRIFRPIAGNRAAWAVSVAVLGFILQQTQDDGIDEFLVRV